MSNIPYRQQSSFYKILRSSTLHSRFILGRRLHSGLPIHTSHT